MKIQKVKMVIEFEVPYGREAYGKRTENKFPWKDYAEHDMLMWIKEGDEVGEHLLETTKFGNVSFQWEKIMDSDDEYWECE